MAEKTFSYSYRHRVLALVACVCISTFSGATVQQEISSANELNGETVYTYNDGSASTVCWGTEKRETYDVAMRLADPTMVGKTIVGARIPMVTKDNISGLKVWITKALALDGKLNVPDIVSADAVVGTDVVEVRFAQPYTVTEEEFYVGYTLTVDVLDENTGKPIVCVPEANDGNGFYVHTSRTWLKWKPLDVTESLAMEVIVGNVDGFAVGLQPFAYGNAKKGEATLFTVTLVNFGSKSINNVDYTYTFNDVDGTGHTDFADNPLPARYGATREMQIELPAVEDYGTYKLSFTLTNVNGQANTDKNNSVSADIYVVEILPEHRVVMEEYTGLWCGFCPRGFVALEELSAKYPDRFIGLSYHSGDILTVQGLKFPSLVGGFPYAWWDRTVSSDPYDGVGGEGYDKAYKNMCKPSVPVAVEVAAELSADGGSVEAKSKVIFTESFGDSPYRIEYILSADGMHGEGSDWLQANYFAGKGHYADGLQAFVEADSYVSGLVFNDVVIAASSKASNDTSLPANITGGKLETHSYSFKLADAKNTYGKSLVQDKARLEVTALVVDTSTGCIINAYKTPVLPNSTGITTVADVAEGAAVYYDMSGRSVESPSKGVFIKRAADGKTVKVMVK